MPVYHWKGLARGHQVEGDLDVDTKEMALRRLRDQGVVVREIRDRDSGERAPIAPLPQGMAGGDAGPEPLAGRLARARAQGPRPLRGLALAAVLIAIAGAIGTLAPVVFVDCVRGDDQPLTCTVSERVLGVYPLREVSLSPVIAADTEARSWTESRGGRPTTMTAHRLVLKDGRGREARPGAWGDSGLLGVDVPTMQARVQALIAEPTAGQVSMWQAAWVPLILPAILLALALLTVGLSVLAMFWRPTDWLYARVGAMAAAADRKRRHGR
jgi:hypothetical protein